MDYGVIYFLMDYGVNYHPSLRACLGKNMQIWKKAMVPSLMNEQNVIIALKYTYFRVR